MLKMGTKNAVALILILILGLSIFMTGCGGQKTSEPAKAPASKAEEPKKEEPKKEEPKKDKIVLRYGAVNPDTHPFLMGIREFAKIANTKSGGRIEIQVFPSSQLGDAKAMVQSVQMGALDMTMLKPGTLVDMGQKKMNVLGLPFLWRDIDHGWKVLDSPIGEELLADIQASGQKAIGLGYYQESARNFFTVKKPIKKLADLKGMKIRVQPMEIQVDMAKALGASPTPIAFSELYSALQTGVVDGAENPITGYYTNKHYEVAKFYTFNEHEAAPSLTIFSEITWKKLSPEDQKIIKESWKESEKFFRKIATQKDEEFIAELKKQGVQFFQVEDKEEWIKAMKPIYEKYGAGLEGLIKRIQDVK